jgi:hypothetical protein
VTSLFLQLSLFVFHAILATGNGNAAHVFHAILATGNGNAAHVFHAILATGNGNGGAAGTNCHVTGNGNGGTAGLHVLIVVLMVLYTEGYLASGLFAVAAKQPGLSLSVASSSGN